MKLQAFPKIVATHSGNVSIGNVFKMSTTPAPQFKKRSIRSGGYVVKIAQAQREVFVRVESRREIRILGEPFVVERDGGQVYLRHEKWSLMGTGNTEGAARLDLVSEAKEIAPILEASADLSPEALRLRHFVQRFA